METPICDFVRAYALRGTVRAHMPGHKGNARLGAERLDITEIAGADELYAADGVIRESERNASRLFGSAGTYYSCGGSSQSIRAMLFLAMTQAEKPEGRPLLLAARNAHRSLVECAALLDFDIEWLYPAESESICSCPVTPRDVASALDGMEKKPFAVYLTSPDYLGGMADVRGIAGAAHARGIPLLADNAHGAYLAFLKPSLHPLHLGADMTADSAHKTLPVLTGGAYLHVSENMKFGESDARRALSLFGSTSPSYLILQSLDRANAELAGGYAGEILRCAERTAELKRRLARNGYRLFGGDPLRVTLAGDGKEIARRLRLGNVEPEYADRDFAVLMLTPDNGEQDFARIEAALGRADGCSGEPRRAEIVRGSRVLSIREAVFARQELVPVQEAAGRIAAAPTVSCPPAVPAVISGERITGQAVRAMREAGIECVSVTADFI